jgi:hypothetical protein
VSKVPFNYMCRGIGYAIGVNNGSGITLLGLFSDGTYPLISPETTSNYVTIMNADKDNKGIWLTKQWSGYFGSRRGTYILTPSEQYESVGYTQSLPVFLSSCTHCGCLGEGTCTNNGICNPRSDTICPDQENVPCGYRGNCFGYCPFGYSCEMEGGRPVCVIENNQSVVTFVFIGILSLIFLASLVLLFVFIAMKPRYKPGQLPVPPVTRATQESTVAVGNTYMQ